MGNYKTLDVWQEARDLSIEIYRITDQSGFKKDFSLRDQIRRAAISVPSNIAEGDESGFNKLGIRYFYNSKASLAELETQIEIAHRINYLVKDDLILLSEKIDRLSRKLRKLIQYRSSL